MRRIILALAIALAACDDKSDGEQEESSSYGGEERSVCSMVLECMEDQCVDEQLEHDSDCQSGCEPGPVPCSPDEEQESMCDEATERLISCQRECMEPHLTGDVWADYESEDAPGYVASKALEACASDSILECEKARMECEESR